MERYFHTAAFYLVRDGLSQSTTWVAVDWPCALRRYYSSPRRPSRPLALTTGEEPSSSTWDESIIQQFRAHLNQSFPLTLYIFLSTSLIFWMSQLVSRMRLTMSWYQQWCGSLRVHWCPPAEDNDKSLFLTHSGWHYSHSLHWARPSHTHTRPTFSSLLPRVSPFAFQSPVSGPFRFHLEPPWSSRHALTLQSRFICFRRNIRARRRGARIGQILVPTRLKGRALNQTSWLTVWARNLFSSEMRWPQIMKDSFLYLQFCQKKEIQCRSVYLGDRFSCLKS